MHMRAFSSLSLLITCSAWRSRSCIYGLMVSFCGRRCSTSTIKRLSLCSEVSGCCCAANCSRSFVNTGKNAFRNLLYVGVCRMSNELCNFLPSSRRLSGPGNARGWSVSSSARLLVLAPAAGRLTVFRRNEGLSQPLQGVWKRCHSGPADRRIREFDYFVKTHSVHRITRDRCLSKLTTASSATEIWQYMVDVTWRVDDGRRETFAQQS